LITTGISVNYSFNVINSTYFSFFYLWSLIVYFFSAKTLHLFSKKFHFIKYNPDPDPVPKVKVKPDPDKITSDYNNDKNKTM
jgi:hypothetical protein